MRKLYLILMSIFCAACFSACNVGEVPTSEDVGGEDLSYLYLKDAKYDMVGYGFKTDPSIVYIGTKQTTERHLTYEGCKVVKENYNSTITHYDSEIHTEQYEWETNYTYDGLMCTSQYPNDYSEKFEYLDDTYLRVKTFEAGDGKIVREYDGKKLTKLSFYSDGKLTYEINYEYEGLNATYTYTHHIFVDNGDIGAWTQQVGGKICYLDDTYLRITYEERDYINEYGDNFKEVITRTYDGKKCVKEEARLQGTMDGYTFNNTLTRTIEYEYDGLKCHGRSTQYYINTQLAFREFMGEVSVVETMELEYLM